ncbi:hypothetical protein LPJ57_009234, partial [Coemansia sp. RSA 486]
MKRAVGKKGVVAGDRSQTRAVSRETSILDRMVGGGSAASSSASLASSHDDAKTPRNTTALNLPAQAKLKGPSSKGKDGPLPQRSFDAASEAEQAEPTWSAAELLEVRARERTFDGAYWRTALGLFGASLVILRMFGLSFFPVGLVFLALGLGFLAIGLYRRRQLLNKDAHAHGPFVTSGKTAQNPYQTYSKEQVEEIRRQRISYVKRNAYISLGLQIAFTAVFAALLGYYINRQRNLSRYDDSWFRWYIGLLIALLVIDLLCIAYTYWQM